MDYLHKMHEDSKEQSEHESKQKETIITLEKQKIELQKQHQDEKRAIMKEKNLIKREEIETHLMFTNLDNFLPPMRDWVAKRQRDILVQDGIVPPDTSSGPSGNNSN